MDKNLLPAHIAIIMDGNRRWAKSKGLHTSFGHKHGIDSLKRILKHINTIGIKHFTVFAFSSENWNREQNEIDYLMELIKTGIINELNELHKNNIKIKFIGDIYKLPGNIPTLLKDAELKTKNNTSTELIVALNYGGKNEIVSATQKITKEVLLNNIKIENIDAQLFSKYLYTEDIPDPDILIRTGGDCRISNFLLWQCAYSELYFTETLWPDFSTTEIDKIINSFVNRERRFGK